MKLVCKCSCGFEDQLTTGKLYDIQAASNNGYYVINDKDQAKWYGQLKFKLILV